MARSSATASALALAAALAAFACSKAPEPAAAVPVPSPAPARADAAAANLPGSGADVVSHASDQPGVSADAGARESAGEPHARTLTVKQPFFGGDGGKDAPVFVARGGDAALLVRRALDDLGVEIPRHRRIIVKVNLGGFDRMKPGKPDDGLVGRITSPVFVRALLVELRARGATDVAVADGRSAPPEEWARLLELSGYRAVLDELGVPFVDLGHYGAGDTRPPPWRLKLPWARALRDELLLSAELIDASPAKRPFLIDVPKLKTHRYAIMSASIKNLMGAVMIGGDEGAPAWRRRWRMHRELSPWLDAWKKSKSDDRAAYRASLLAFSERLADLYGVLTPDLVLIEGMPASAGDGFAAIAAYPSADAGQGIVIASRNGCYADFVAARFFGLADSDALEREIGTRMPPAILAVADRYFGGVSGLAKIVVRGDSYLPDSPNDSAWFKGMAPFEIGHR